MNNGLPEPMQKMFDQQCEQAQKVRVRSGQLTLGKTIKLLEMAINDDPEEEAKDPKKVYFDFCRLVPNGIDSYRGYYDELAVNWCNEGWDHAGKEIKGWPLTELIAELKAAVGKTYEGYKGGDFKMTEDTPLWVANYGESGSTAIVGVLDQGWCVIIETLTKE